MKTANRTLSVILVILALAFSLTGCGNKSENNDNSNIQPISQYTKFMEDNLIENGDEVGSDSVGIHTIKVLSVTPVFNLKESDIKTENLSKSFYGVYAESGEIDGKRESFTLSDCFDNNTGCMKDGYCFFLVEYEIYNKSVKKFDCYKDNSSMKTAVDIFYLAKPMYNATDGNLNISQIVYFEEYGEDYEDEPYAINLKVGETKKIHIGYILKDKSETPYSKVGFTNSVYYPKNNYSWVEFDISQEAVACKNSDG